MTALVDKVTAGRIVHYRVAEFDSAERSNGVAPGDLLPAIVVRVWEDSPDHRVQLQVFTDSPVGTVWKTSIAQGDAHGQWSWPARV